MVDEGEWVAHVIAQQFAMLKQFAEILLVTDPGLAPPCNPMTCPEMSAGSVTYTWLDHNRIPTRMAASKYIELVLKWIEGRLEDTRIFPNDPNAVAATAPTYPSGGVSTPHSNVPIAAGSTNLNAPLSVLAGKTWLGKDSGFPENFENEAKNIMRLMFRVYGHIYWSHFVDPYYHLNLDRAVNAGFMYFLTFANEFDLLNAAEVEPMQKLIDIWTSTHQNFNAWGVKSSTAQAAKESSGASSGSNLAVPTSGSSSQGFGSTHVSHSQSFEQQNITPQGYNIMPPSAQGFGMQSQPTQGFNTQPGGHQSGGNTPMSGMTPPPQEFTSTGR